MKDPEEEGSPDASETRRTRLLKSYKESGETLVHEASPRLYRRARRHGVDLAAARDIVQQAFLALFSKRPRLENVEAWLVKVVDRQTRLWRRREARASAGDEPLRCEVETPLGLLSADDRLAVRHGVDRLPARQRRLVLLRYFEDCGEAEAATRAGLAPSSFKKTMTRALTRLRHVLTHDSAPKPAPPR